MDLNAKNIKKILFLIFCGALIFTLVQNFSLVIGVIRRIVGIFSPIIAAFCIAFVLNILLTALETKAFKFIDKSKKNWIKKLKRPICLVLTYLIAFGAVTLLIWVIIPDIIETVTFLANRLPVFIGDARVWLEGLLDKFNLTQVNLPDIKINWNAIGSSIVNWLSGSGSAIFGGAVNITTSVFSGIFDTLFSFVISVYILVQKEKIGKFTRRVIDAFIPKSGTKLIYHVSHRTYSSFAKFIGGQLTESLILGVLCFIGMSIFRFPNALIISVLICVTSLVPIVGATIGVITGFLLIVITNPIKALLFVVFFLILQQVEGNFIYPKVVGKAVGLPGVIVVSAVLVGGNIGGVLGSLLAVPASAVLYTLLKETVDWLHAKKAENAPITEEVQE